MHVVNCCMSSSSYAIHASCDVCSHDVMYECEVASLFVWISVDAFISLCFGVGDSDGPLLALFFDQGHHAKF